MKTVALGLLLLIASALVSVGTTLAVMRGVPTARERLHSNDQFEVFGSTPSLHWTYGGSRGKNFAHVSAWIKANVHGITLTLFLDDADIQRLTKRVNAGICDDYCTDPE